MVILGLETSCDETAASIIKAGRKNPAVLSNVVSSQVALHSRYGGVVPNLAAREHLKNIIPVINEALEKAEVTAKNIDLIVVTAGPGLIPALLIGTSAAKTLSYLWKKPLIGIHHIEGHIYANFITPHPILSLPRRGIKGEVKFPILCLVVSGGHTQLVLMKKHLDYEIIGQTLDDAAGEAFDKVARMLGLGYPGGPAIAATAANFQFLISNFQSISNDKILKLKKQKGEKIPDTKYQILNTTLPRPMLKSGDFNFSFSGLKTAVLYLTKKNGSLLKNKKFVAEVCHEFQQAAVDVLIHKTIAAAKKYNPKTIMLAGGVSANIELRKQLREAVKRDFSDTLYIMPDTCYSIDNAAMIAAAAFFRHEKNKKNKKFMDKIRNNWKNLEADANLKLI